MAVKTRIPPLPREEWTEAARKLFTLFEGPDAYEEGSKSNVFLTMARHPKLGESFFKYSGRLLMTSKVDVSLREIAILRIAWLYRSPYEWAQHVEFSLYSRKFDAEAIEAYRQGKVIEAETVGVLTMEQIEAVKQGADHPIWSPIEAATIRAVDQLKANGHIEDETWAELSEYLGEQLLIELVFIFGTYAMLGWVLNAFGVPPEQNQMQYAADVINAMA